MSVNFVELEEAQAASGLRVVYVPGVPSPWGEAAKGILYVKQIPYRAVRQGPGVAEWTGSTSAPVALYEEEAPRGGWAEILLLAERLAPEPRLIPVDAAERALMFGLSHEICGEGGLGWSRRLMGIAAALEDDGASGAFARPVAEYLAPKYGYRPGCGAEAKARTIALVQLLAGRLHESRSGYLLGDSLTALDIYCAAFAALFRPLPPEHCPMPDALRETFSGMDPELEEAVDPMILEHRDRIYQEHLELPLTL